MASLTANINRPVRVPAGGLTTEKVPLDNLDNTIYKGAILICDVSAQDGYFRDHASGITEATGDIFGGVALERVTTTTGLSDGDKYCTVAVDGVWGFPKGALAQTDIGSIVSATDDNTVAAYGAATLKIGLLVEVDDTYAWVDIAPRALRANSA